MRTRESATGWICIDCMMLLANGETPHEMTESETADFLARIDSRDDGEEITLGMLWEEHADDCENRAAGEWITDCDCETDSFSWHACDMCGSRLGGERHAVTYWTETETGTE